jgi:hypothetical protein
MRLAIMQPYFIPYAGYFRLFACSDLFIIYDYVQFPRRGWVHRNKLSNRKGEPDWLTLPLKKMPRDTTTIKDLEFAEAADATFYKETQKFEIFSSGKYKHPLKDAVMDISGTPLEYIVKTLKTACVELGIKFNVEYSSRLNLPHEIKGQERILSICRHFGAREYINPPGGVELYNHDEFAKNNIKLRFLGDYRGNKISILERLVKENNESVAREIQENC